MPIAITLLDCHNLCL